MNGVHIVSGIYESFGRGDTELPRIADKAGACRRPTRSAP